MFVLVSLLDAPALCVLHAACPRFRALSLTPALDIKLFGLLRVLESSSLRVSSLRGSGSGQAAGSLKQVRLAALEWLRSPSEERLEALGQLVACLRAESLDIYALCRRVELVVLQKQRRLAGITAGDRVREVPSLARVLEGNTPSSEEESVIEDLSSGSESGDSWDGGAQLSATGLPPMRPDISTVGQAAPL